MNAAMSDIERAVKAMGREPINPIGECFDSTGFQAMKWLLAGKLFKVCHGIGIASMPGQQGREMKHAWLEVQGLAYDTTWGVTCNAGKYRSDLKLRYVIEYDPEDFFRNWIKHDFPGPWDEKIEAAGRTA